MEYESKLTDIIDSLPEINGGFLYAPDRGIYSNQTTNISDDNALQQISIKLSKIVSMLSVHFHDTGGIRVTFKDLILYGIRVDDANWLFLLHEPSLSAAMVKMTVQMALNIQSEDEELPPPAPPEESKFDLQELMNPASNLGIALATIKDELATHIGPVAELVFADDVESWNNTSSSSMKTLPELVLLLEREIDNEQARVLFRTNLKSIAGARG